MSEHRGQVETLELLLPATTKRASVLRTVAATLGADAGFSIDEIDDLRLCLSEVLTVLTDAVDAGAGDGAAPALRVAFELGDDQLTIVVLTAGVAEGPVEFDPLATSILDAVVDDLEISDTAVRLVKRAAERTADAHATSPAGR